MKKFIAIMLVFASFSSFAENNVKHFWPKVPFNIVGANLCEYRSAYSQSRSDYMSDMVGLAERLLYMGVYDPVGTLTQFNQLYNQNLYYARRGLGVTLEQSFKAYLDSYYRNLKPSVKKLQFKYFDRIAATLNQGGTIDPLEVHKLDLMAHGSYSMSANCDGGVFATLTIIQKDGTSLEYVANGPAQTVMSQIASRVFEDFQRTKFPSTIKVGQTHLTLLGGLTGNIDMVNRPADAQMACDTLGARLPTEQEYKILNAYGIWSGGITLSHEDWVLSSNRLLNITHHYHVRSYQSGVNGKYRYICVK